MIPPLPANGMGMPVTLEWCYNEEDVPDVSAYPDMQLYANYQIQSVKPGASYSRFFPTAQLRKRLGIDYCDSTDVLYTYYGQLNAAVNPSIWCRLRTITPSATVLLPLATYAVTYHYRFRGLTFDNI